MDRESIGAEARSDHRFRAVRVRKRTALALACALGALGLALLALASLFGGAFQPLDSVAHFRAHLALAALVLAILAAVVGSTLLRLIALAASLAAIVAGATTSVYMVPVDGVSRLSFMSTAAGVAPAPIGSIPATASGIELTLLQMNLRYDAVSEPALAAIRESGADIVTLEEVTPRWSQSLAAIADLYPHRFDCGLARPVGGMVILSRRPFADDLSICVPDDGFAARRIALDEGRRLTIGAEHLKWPWPHDHWYQIAALEPVLARLAGPLVIGGDFNAAPWSAAVSRYAKASDTRPVAGIGPTFLPSALPSWLKRFAGLSIDNVLVSEGVSVSEAKTLPATGSDHLPVLIRLFIADLASKG
ncbi:MAG: endonuclease/exonuclease/phosphatase family protein [Pseudomonadota bacterium]|nr:endonuclease/exonuclease/phosphatase family protein [Pseudomonadota bacterium]